MLSDYGFSKELSFCGLEVGSYVYLLNHLHVILSYT